MRAIDRLDRAVLRFVSLTGMWAIDTPFEPLATSRRKAAPAAQEEVTASGLQTIESSLRQVVTGLRNWILAGVLLVLACFSAVAFVPAESAAGATFVALAFCLVAWTAWVIVAMLGWRVQPGYGLADRVAVALKRGQLGDGAIAAVASLPEDSLVLLMLQPLLKRSA